MAAQIYPKTLLNNNFLFSLISITWPEYNAMESAGITSDSPTSTMANGSWVSSYTHQPTRVFIIRSPMMKQNLPSIRFLYSGIRTAAKGSLVTCEVVELSSIQYACKGKRREADS